MIIQTPEWVKDAIFYQIFPDRFAFSNPPSGFNNYQKGANLEPWHQAPQLQTYKGGNFWGIIEKLDYLQDLGFNAIYFTPIFQSTCNHRYHTHDYYQVDPLLESVSEQRSRTPIISRRRTMIKTRSTDRIDRFSFNQTNDISDIEAPNFSNSQDPLQNMDL